MGAVYTQHAEFGENCFLLWKSNECGLMFRACTVSYAKAQNAKDFGKDTNAFLLAINSLRFAYIRGTPLTEFQIINKCL